jgi:hypothetical protein
MGKIYRHNGTSFVEVPSGTKFNIRDAGVWKNPSKVYVRDAGTWKEVWAKSDPVTITTSVSEVRSFRRSDGTGSMVWDPIAADYAYIGRSSDGRYDLVGVYKLDNALFGSAAGSRTVVKQASFTLERDSSAGSASYTRTLYLGLYNRSLSISPLYTSLDFSPNAAWNRTWTQGATYTWDLDATGLSYAQDVADALIASGTVNMALSGATSGWDETGDLSGYYSRFEGPATGHTGVLSITLDYV